MPLWAGGLVSNLQPQLHSSLLFTSFSACYPNKNTSHLTGLLTVAVIQDLCIGCRLLVSSSPAHYRTKSLGLLSQLFPQSPTHLLPSIQPPFLPKNLPVSFCHVARASHWASTRKRPQLFSGRTSDVAITIGHFPSHPTAFLKCSLPSTLSDLVKTLSAFKLACKASNKPYRVDTGNKKRYIKANKESYCHYSFKFWLCLTGTILCSQWIILFLELLQIK